jgi:branched-chain amino acid transport system substrate-binding protein
MDLNNTTQRTSDEHRPLLGSTPMHSRKVTTMIIAAALALTTAACTSSETVATSSTQSNSVSLFGTDGIMSNSFGDTIKVAGQLDGMSGTAALNPPNPAFDAALLKRDPGLDDFSYAGQAYDAVMITALAAQIAGSTSGTEIAKYVNGVTELAPGGVECSTFADCMSAIAKGKDIAYRGITVTSGFTNAGEPSTASYGTLHFGSDNHIAGEKTEFVNAGDESTASTQISPPPAPIAFYNGPALNLGLLLPKTGALASQGKPIIAGADLAISQINSGATPGVLGKPIVTEFADDGTDPVKAVAGAKRLIADGATAIIGPSFSGASTAVIPVAVRAGVMVMSPSATASSLSTINDHGLFFRTAPSDILQAQAIADIIVRSGAQRVFIVARSDDYGTPLAHDASTALTEDGMPAANVTTGAYSAAANANNATTYAQIAASVRSFHADAVLLIGYEEIGGMISALSTAGLQFKSN